MNIAIIIGVAKFRFLYFLVSWGGGMGGRGILYNELLPVRRRVFPVRVVKATSPACDIVSLSQSASAKASGSPDVKSIPLPKFRPRSYRPPLGFSRKGGAG